MVCLPAAAAAVAAVFAILAPPTNCLRVCSVLGTFPHTVAAVSRNECAIPTDSFACSIENSLLAFHSDPSVYTSFFQMGTLAFNSSIMKRHAANASGRCSAETTIITELSLIGTTPSRCPQTTCFTPSTLSVACAKDSNSLRAIGSYASNSRRRTSFPSKLFRVTPLKLTMAPQQASATSSSRSAKHSLSCVKKTRQFPS
mmetsp:Transcript_64004/g.169465  ORF Transcript_64004/g.169465 Transcript_64004/m.169465 type:complete len:200 (+) Transcript_64004:778-1377(+)